MKKKLFALVLAGLLAVSAAGCGSSASSRFKDVDEFIEKYKREDIETLESNPKNFINDVASVLDIKNPNLAGWTLDEEDSLGDSEWYQKEAILFNHPVDIDVIVYDGITGTIFTSFDLEDMDSNFSMAAALCEYMFKTYDDAEGITVGGDESSESDLKEVFAKKDLSKKFSCEWKVGKSGEYEKYIGISYSYISSGSYESNWFYVGSYLIEP